MDNVLYDVANSNIEREKVPVGEIKYDAEDENPNNTVQYKYNANDDNAYFTNSK